MADHDPTTPPTGRPRVRIGDAERQRMTDLLQQHLGAGRLDMAEYERRVEHATSAVFEQDLDGLLDDLPVLDDDGEPVGHGGRRPAGDADHDRAGPSWWPPRPTGGGRASWARGFPSPLLVVAGIGLVVLTHGWILFPLLFLALASRGGGACRPRHGHGSHRAHGRSSWTAGDPDSTSDRPGPGDGPRWPGRFDPFGDDVRRM